MERPELNRRCCGWCPSHCSKGSRSKVSFGSSVNPNLENHSAQRDCWGWSVGSDLARDGNHILADDAGEHAISEKAHGQDGLVVEANRLRRILEQANILDQSDGQRCREANRVEVPGSLDLETCRRDAPFQGMAS